MNRICLICNKTGPSSIFARDGGGYIYNWCVDCKRNRDKESYHEKKKNQTWLTAERKRIREYRKRMHSSGRFKEYIQSSYRQWLYRRLDWCRRSKHECTIDLDYLCDIWREQHGTCPLTKLPLETKYNSLHSASIDRINNDFGYVKGNIRIVCRSINLARNTHSDPVIIEFISNIKGSQFITREADKEHRITNLSKNSAPNKVEKSIRSWLKYKLHSARKRISHDLSIDHLIRMWDSQGRSCKLSGLPMSYRCHCPYSASIDRIDNSLGYSEENIQLVCRSVNLAKNRHNNTDFIQWLKNVQSIDKALQVANQ